MDDVDDVSDVSDVGGRRADRPVIGVIGGSGGVGSSAFAAVVAIRAGAVLVDLDVTGGGIDVLLGLEDAPGARWSGLELAGGRLDPAALRAGLPRVGPCAVLAADVAVLEPGPVDEVLTAAVATGPVVVALPRATTPARAAALGHCDLVVVLVRADVSGLVAAHALVATLTDELPIGAAPLPLGVVVRRAEVDPLRAARLIGVPSLGVLPPLPAAGRPFEAMRLPRATVRVADGVLVGVTRPGTARVA